MGSGDLLDEDPHDVMASLVQGIDHPRLLNELDLLADQHFIFTDSRINQVSRIREIQCQSFPELREWLYSDEEYLNQELWPLKNTCKKEAHRPLVCILKKGHPGPHISLDVWQEVGF